VCVPSADTKSTMGGSQEKCDTHSNQILAATVSVAKDNVRGNCFFFFLLFQHNK